MPRKAEPSLSSKTASAKTFSSCNGDAVAGGAGWFAVALEVREKAGRTDGTWPGGLERAINV